MAHDELHVHLLAVPAVGVIHRVDVPHAVVVVGNVNELRRHVERTLVAGEIILAVAVVVLKVDVRAAVDHAQVARAQRSLQLLRAAVEHQHVRVRDLLHHQLPHVLHEQLERRRVDKGHDLIEHPVGGQHVAVELFHLPHAVVLDEHLLRPVLLFQLLAERERQLLLVVHGHDRHVVERLLLVLLVALLAADEQRLILAGEAVLQNAVDEIRLAGVQKTGDQINRNIHTIVSLSNYTPKSAWSLSPLSSAPMTQSLPV